MVGFSEMSFPAPVLKTVANYLHDVVSFFVVNNFIHMRVNGSNFLEKKLLIIIDF